jgi:2-isopropylmalate synthase
MLLPNNLPFVGKSAFAHKGGIHVSGINKDPKTYEHLDPESVGNSRRVLVSDLSGKSNLLYKIREFGDLDPEDLDLQSLVEHIKTLEYEGYQFEGADGSLKLLLYHFGKNHEKPFDFQAFRVVVDQSHAGQFISEASVKVKVGGVEEHTVAEGDGPVHALDRAVKKALVRFYPEIEEIHLVDYKVRVLDARQGTAAKVRVLIESRDGQQSWTTIGVSPNLMEASWMAIIDSVLYKLLFASREGKSKKAPGARIQESEVSTSS